MLNSSVIPFRYSQYYKYPGGFMKLTAGLITFLIFVGTYAVNDDRIDQARDYLRTDYDRAITVTEEILEDNPNNIDALWIKSVAYSNIANYRSGVDKEELFEKANDLADRALSVNEGYADAHYAKAVALGRKAESAGAREGVRLSREIKEYAERAIELDPEHGGAWYINGMLLYRIANLSRMERFAANAIFGGFPFEASNEKAIDALEKSVEYSPDNIYYYIGLATALKTDNQNGRAQRVLEQAQNLEPITPEDPEHLETVDEMLSDL